MNKIGLIAAMIVELPSSIRYSKKGSNIFQFSSYQFKTQVSGIGFNNASITVERMCLDFKPDLLILLGFCGGVGPALDIGDLCIPDEVHYEIKVNSSLLKLIRTRMDDKSLKYHTFSMQTFNQPVLDKNKVSDGIYCVDMEAFEVLQKASEKSVPAIVVKSVTDVIPDKKPLLFTNVYPAIRILMNYSRIKKSLDTFFEEIILS
jgi:nucleoside phosphorylase